MINPLDELSDIYLGQISEADNSPEAIKARVMQHVRAIRYRARKEGDQLTKAYNDYMAGQAGISATEKSMVKERLGLTGGAQHQEGMAYGLSRGSGKPSGPMAAFGKKGISQANPRSQKKKTKPTVTINKPDRLVSLRVSKEGYYNWRHELSEYSGMMPKKNGDAEVRITEKKVKNKVTVNPAQGQAESFAKELGGQLLEACEVFQIFEVDDNQIQLLEVKDRKGKGSGTKDACYHKVKSRYSVWPSAYASGALVKCRRVGADNWGNSTKKEDVQWKDIKYKAKSGESTFLSDSDGNIAFEIVDVIAPAVAEEKKPMVKVKLNPSKKIGVKVTDIGPGGKEVVRKNTMDEDYETQKTKEVMAALKKRDLKQKVKEKIAADIVKRKGDVSKSDDRYAYESVEQIDELSKTTTANYLYQAKVDKNYVHGGKMGKYAKARDKGIKRAEKKLGKKVSDRVNYVADYDTRSMRDDPNKSEYPRKLKVKEEVVSEGPLGALAGGVLGGAVGGPVGALAGAALGSKVNVLGGGKKKTTVAKPAPKPTPDVAAVRRKKEQDEKAKAAKRVKLAKIMDKEKLNNEEYVDEAAPVVGAGLKVAGKALVKQAVRAGIKVGGKTGGKVVKTAIKKGGEELKRQAVQTAGEVSTDVAKRVGEKTREKLKGKKVKEGYSNWRDTLDEKCWAGYEKKGMKTMFGKRYPNCVKKKTNSEEVEFQEKLDLKKADMGDVVKDFYKSDAPQFKGRSKEKRREMAIAAKLTAERGKLPEEVETVDEAKYEKGASDYGKTSIRNKRAFGKGGNARPPEERGAAKMLRHDAHQKRRFVKKNNKYGATNKPPVYGAPSDEFKKDRYATKEAYSANPAQQAAIAIAKKERKQDLKVSQKKKMKEEIVTELNRFEKEKGVDTKTGKPVTKGGTAKSDKAFQFVMKKFGKQRMGANQPKKVRGAKNPNETSPTKQKLTRMKAAKASSRAFETRAKKAGYKTAQDYANVAARYGGEDNMKKGRGLGT